jgi:putative molybdopterin biosynthesis protein
MNMHIKPYLGTEEAAEYLRISERKLYEMVAAGAVPCSKVTGKWLFPRAALDRWIEAGLAGQGAAEAVPPIIGGSHDPLLEWASRHAGSGLALLSEGSEAGLDRLERNAVAIAAIHLHAPVEVSDDEGANIAAVKVRAMLADAVVIGFARREQGLVVAEGNPLGLVTLRDVLASRARIAMRQRGAGAHQLLERLIGALGTGLHALHAAPGVHATGQDLVRAIRAGDADCGIATRAVAEAQGLGFVPLAWERFDLAMRRRTYFEPGSQALFGAMRGAEFARQAATLSGYDLSEAGTVRLNR